MNEAIIVNKETNLTSRDVVNRLNKILKTKKIGHTGTLDPLATGVLVCLVNKYTKLVPLITAEDKEYIAEIKIGIKTDTLDITGEVLEEKEVSHLKENEIINVFNSLVGKYEETIPLYSAVSINGKRLYEYAREGINVDLPKRIVEIKELTLLKYDNNIIRFKTIVSKGTYIRSLIQSICDKLNIIGTMNSLIRTRQGQFTIENAYTLEEIEKGNYKSLKLEDLIDLEKIELDNTLEKKVLNGNKINIAKEGYILFVKQNKEIALYFSKDNIGKLIILF